MPLLSGSARSELNTELKKSGDRKGEFKPKITVHRGRIRHGLFCNTPGVALVGAWPSSRRTTSLCANNTSAILGRQKPAVTTEEEVVYAPNDRVCGKIGTDHNLPEVAIARLLFTFVVVRVANLLANHSKCWLVWRKYARSTQHLHCWLHRPN